ncbi:MAG: mechanosensitive ion channel [Lachnospiraceae bacterium]|nr:mechanosensitive ion channel [Lachnospiraceae bacterium]
MVLETTTISVEEAAANVEQSVDLVKETIDGVIKWLIDKSGSVIAAFIFIFIGIKITGWFVKLAKRGFDKSKIDDSVAGFLLSVIRIICYILVFITAATIVGFEVTSFVAILTTASMAIGLALQGALSNLAGGVLILLLKPFKVGDYIVENNGHNEGNVVSIDIFYTRLLTHDNKLVVIPNGILTNSSLVNVTNEPKRKLEITIPVAYNTDIKKMKDIVYGILEADERILDNEAKDIFINSFDDSGMTIAIRAWTATSNFWSTLWDLRENVKAAFDENGIEIPYNRLEVSMRN